MKVNVRYLVFAVLFIILPEKSYCQKILDPEYYPPDVRWDNFLLKGGEASQETISMLIDSKGFLWSGNETGLYRFDGIRYKEYGISNGDNRGFTGYMVTNIFEDSEGKIWIGTSEALNKLDQKTGTFLHYFPDSANKSATGNFIRAIREDRDGMLWILTKKDIYSFDRKQEKFKHFAVDSLSWYSLNMTYVPEDQCFAEDSLGNKWFVTKGGLCLYNPYDKSFSIVLPDPGNNEWNSIIKVRCVTTGKNGKILIGTEGEGLLTWNYSLNKPEKIGPRPAEKNPDSFEAVSTILVGRNGSIWSFGNGTFSNFNPKDKTVRNYIINYKYRTVYETPGSEIFTNQAFQYDDGTIWFLNKLAGLMFKFNPVTEKLSLYRAPSYIVYQCIMDKTGSFWCACIRNNIFRLVTNHFPYLTIAVDNSSHVAQIHRGTILEDDQNQIYFLFMQGIYTYREFDVSSSLILGKFRFPDGDTIAGGGFKDSKGNLWFGNKKGSISKYDPSTLVLTNFKPDYLTDYTEVIFVPLIREDKAGNIWIASYNGLYRINMGNDKPEHIMVLDDKSGKQDPALLHDFLIDSYGIFWIMTSESILSLRMPEMEVTDYTGNVDNVSANIMSAIRMSEDSDGNNFILTSRQGIYRFNRQNNSFIKVDIINEAPGSEYYDLLIDRNDRLWIAHNRGITVYDPRDKSSRLMKTPKLQFDVQSFQTHSGQIIFVNNNHLYIFYEDIPSNNYVPPVYLTGLLINGQDFNKTFPAEKGLSSLKKINLPFRFNTLNFEFAALNYLNPERNQYRYFMDGFDRDTTLIEQGISAEYRNMPPGHYRFWVTGSNNDGLWNPEGLTLDIRIHPPWYRSIISYIVYVTFCFDFNWSIYKIQNKKSEKG